MLINEAQDAIIEEFEAFDDWIDRYQPVSYTHLTLPTILLV